MENYFNEYDLYPAAWLRNLIEAGHIAPGFVDTRSIEDVRPSDLAGFKQCHFFSGIGVWSLALRRAGWPDDRSVWTGSCPCQPFSAAGKGAGFADERHLWPAFHHLIKEQKPECIFGEQVASKAVDDWIDLVQADLEALGYAFGAVPFPSASVGAPHIRDRTYWAAIRNTVGQADGSSARLQKRIGDGRIQRKAMESYERQAAICRSDISGMANSDTSGASRFGADSREGAAASRIWDGSADSGESGGLADSANPGFERRRASEKGNGRNAARFEPERFCDAGGMEHPQGDGRQQRRPESGGRGAERRCEPNELVVLDGGVWTGPTNGFWESADWLACRDGKWRPVESGTFPLAHGDTSRVGRLRAYGNAINVEQARIFIETVMEALE